MSTLKVNTIDSHSGSSLTFDSTADVVVASATSASSNTTGALKVAGGISTQENLYVGGNAVITGTMTANGGTITLGDANTDNVSFGGEVNSDVVPDATNTYDLGSSSKKWAEIHATTLNGALTGNVTGNVTGNLTGDVTGNSDTATALETARNIGGVSFDGSANINLPGVNTSGNQDTSGNAATATALETARTIGLSGDVSGSVSFDGSANATITATIADDSHNHTTANVDGLDSALAAKAPLASPALTGTPTAPTAAANTNNTQVATTAYVQTEITDLIGGAPGALDTLNELAAAINDDSSYASTVTSALGGKVATSSAQALSSAANAMTISGNTITLNRGDGTTDTVTVPDNDTTYSVGDGGLTQKNFTTTLKDKLDGIAASANNYTHPSYDGDDFSIDTGHLSGATVIDDLDINVTTDSSGHVTDANATVATRNLTLADLGYTGATNANYITNNNELTNGSGYITSYTDTTYSAGTGLDLSGTTFSIESDLREGGTGSDRYWGNTHDYIFADASHGLRFYTTGNEEMRLEDDGDLHVDGDVVAYSTTVSDERLKTGILPITNALDKVNQLKGCTFTYTADGKKSAGLIAQDVEKVLPTAVSEKELPLKTEDGETYKVVQYDQTIGLLVEAIKELTDKVSRLENS